MLKEITSFRDIVAINFTLTNDATMKVHDYIHSMDDNQFDNNRLMMIMMMKAKGCWSPSGLPYTPYIPYAPPQISCMPCWLSKIFIEGCLLS